MKHTSEVFDMNTTDGCEKLLVAAEDTGQAVPHLRELTDH